MRRSRRHFLRICGTATALSLAGCQSEGADSSTTIGSASTTEDSTTESPTETATETETPTPEPLTGNEVYEQELPTAETELDQAYDDGIHSLEDVQATLEEDQRFRGAIENAETGVDILAVYTDHGADMTENTWEGTKIIQYLITNNIGLDEEVFDTDNTRVFHDLGRPGPIAQATIIHDGEIYDLTPRGAATGSGKDLTLGNLRSIEHDPYWNPENTNAWNALDYQAIDNHVPDYGGWEEADAENYEIFIEEIEDSISYTNSKGWLAPTRDFHRHIGQAHLDQNTNAVVRLRDRANALKERHAPGEGERLVLDITDEYELVDHGLTDDFSFADGYADV